MLDWNIIIAAAVMVGIIVLIRFVFPLYKDRKSLYADIKAGLLLFGYAFRDDKVKAIADIMYGVVSAVEELDKSNPCKQRDAVARAHEKLLQEIGVEIDSEAMELMVDIAVAYLPPTGNKEIHI